MASRNQLVENDDEQVGMRAIETGNIQGRSRCPSSIQADAEIALAGKKQKQKNRNVNQSQPRRIVTGLVQMMQNRHQQVEHVASFEYVVEKRLVQIANAPNQ